MNKWECDAPGCDSSAVGVGGAVGLAAVGWYFRPGSGTPWGTLHAGALYCPLHRPDPLPECISDGPADRRPGPCSPCRAEQEMREWQRLMGWVYGYDYEP